MKSTFASILVMTLFSIVFPGSALAETENIVHMGSFSKAVDYAPYLVAKQKHLFDDVAKKYKSTITYEEFQSLPSINESFASKKLDFVFEAETPCLVGKAAGIDLKMVGMSAIVDVPTIAHKNSDVKTLGDLKGKKIAVLAGTSAHYVLLKKLESVHLTKNDVSILNMTPPDAKSAFDSNKIDAWCIWSPFPDQEELNGNAADIPNGSGKVEVVMVGRTDFTKDHADLTKALVDVLKSTRAWVEEHPAEAQKITAEQLKVPLNVVEKAWFRLDWKSELGEAALVDIQKKADFLKSVGFVRQSVDAKSLVSAFK